MTIQAQTKAIAVALFALMAGLGTVSMHAAQQVMSLHEAVERGDVAEVSRLLATDVGRSQLEQRWGKLRDAPLHRAARLGNEAVSRLLLDSGANVSAMAIDEITPLYFAVCNRATPVASLLLESGADVSAVNSSGSTALHKAVAEELYDAFLLLFNHGADIAAVNKRGNSCLDYALEWTLLSRLNALDKARLEAVYVWTGHLQQNCGLPKVVVNQIILPMALTDNQHRRFENLARTPDRTGNPRPCKRARGAAYTRKDGANR